MKFELTAEAERSVFFSLMKYLPTHCCFTPGRGCESDDAEILTIYLIYYLLSIRFSLKFSIESVIMISKYLKVIGSSLRLLVFWGAALE